VIDYMLKKTMACLLVAGGAVLGTAATASAQQTLNFTVGEFAVRGESGRVGANCSSCGTSVDVLVADRDFLTFDVKDFNGPTVGGEWLVPLGQFIEGGAGVAFTSRTVPSVYTNYVQANGSEVDQDLRLRTIPVSFTLRLLPLGQTSPVQPYVGGGVSVSNWRYTESGNFIDFDNNQAVFNDTFTAKGTATGPVVLGGLRFASRTFAVGGEVRYQKAEGTVGSDFAGTKLDLGGWTYQATAGIRFGR
jgi:outer membrane protein W